jgi:hypothetical protein
LEQPGTLATFRGLSRLSKRQTRQQTRRLTDSVSTGVAGHCTSPGRRPVVGSQHETEEETNPCNP